MLPEDTISVIMGIKYCRPELDTLRRSLDSILAQTYAEFELLICERGSSHLAKELLADYASRDPRVRVIDGSGAACVGCNVRLIQDGGDVGAQCFPENPQVRDFLFSMPFIHPALIFRREALEAAGGYSTLPRCDRCEDYDLLLRLYEMGYSGANMQEFLFRYSLPHNGISTRTLRDRTNEVRTRWARFSALGLLPKALPYALKPWAVWLVPRNTLRRLKEKRAAKSGDKL